MKVHLSDLNIPDLSEMATDHEIDAAYRYLCKLQKNLRTLQNDMARNSRIVYHRYYLQKLENYFDSGQRMKWGNAKETVVVEKSRKIMEDLSMRRDNLTKDPDFLAKVDSWHLK